MSKYYSIDRGSDEDGYRMRLKYNQDEPSRSWADGNPFLRDSPHASLAPPPEPVEVQVVERFEDAPLPEFVITPIPLVSRKLLDVLRAAGIDNIDAYRVELRFADGSLASDELFAFKLIGKLAAADLEHSVYDEGQPDSTISMSFDSLVVDESKSHGLLMFRLAENVTTILVHESVKHAVEAANIELVEFYDTKDIAIL